MQSMRNAASLTDKETASESYPMTGGITHPAIRRAAGQTPWAKRQSRIWESVS